MSGDLLLISSFFLDKESLYVEDSSWYSDDMSCSVSLTVES